MIVTFPQTWTAIMDDPTGATYAPASYAQATNNLCFCMAVGLHGGKVYIEQFAASRWYDPTILATVQRVTSRSDAALGHIFATTDTAPTALEVVLESGMRHQIHVDYPRGCPQNPSTQAELEAKFAALAQVLLPMSAQQHFQDILGALARLPYIEALLASLCH